MKSGSDTFTRNVKYNRQKSNVIGDKRHQSYSLLTAEVYDYRLNDNKNTDGHDIDMLEYNSNNSDALQSLLGGDEKGAEMVNIKVTGSPAQPQQP